MELEKLIEQRNLDVREIDRDSLVKADNIQIDARQPQKERIQSLLEQTNGNPYVYEDMGYVVKHSFDDEAKLSFADCAKELVAKRAGILL